MLFAGVTRPASFGVTRPLYREDAERAPVYEPGPGREALEEATEELLECVPRLTVGADNLLYAMKTPHLSGQEK